MRNRARVDEDLRAGGRKCPRGDRDGAEAVAERQRCRRAGWRERGGAGRLRDERACRRGRVEAQTLDPAFEDERAAERLPEAQGEAGRLVDDDVEPITADAARRELV